MRQKFSMSRLLVPALAALFGVVNGFRMRRLPDLEPQGEREGIDFG